MPARAFARLIYLPKLASNTALLFFRAVTKGNVLLAQGQGQTVLKASWVDFNRMRGMDKEGRQVRTSLVGSHFNLFHINTVLFRASDCSSISKSLFFFFFLFSQGTSHTIKAHKDIVLVHLGRYKNTTYWWLQTTEILFHSSGGWKTNIGGPARLSSDEGPLPDL